MRSAIIKKASQDEQQNQTTITTNIKFIQNLCHFSKQKHIKKVKIASDNTETKQNNLYFTRKDKRVKRLAYIYKNH